MALFFPSRGLAHASEQGFVLLLPTEFYTGAGVVAVVLTAVVLLLAPSRWVEGLFRPRMILPRGTLVVAKYTQAISGIFLLLLVSVGIYGPTDPLSNPLPLTIWVVFWIMIVSVQALVFDIWRYISPVAGLARVLRAVLGPWRYTRLPASIGHWPAVFGFLLFAYVLLADPKPSDPNHLARLVLGYLVFHVAFTLVYGPRWLLRGETFTVTMRALNRLAILGRAGPHLAIGVSGWQILNSRIPSLSLALVCVILLGVGSFDGLNETFWWMSQLGLNPLEFGGRSSVEIQNTLGMLAANLLLIGIFSASLWVGVKIARAGMPIHLAFRHFAMTLLPIAAGYHVAHYLPSFLVDGQYTLVALSDPLMTGADLLRLGEFYVSTSFFNSQAPVRVIYLTQASFVTGGHIVSVLVAHAVALRIFGDRKTAILVLLPLSIFMLAYTYFGLWLLASPRF